MDISDVIEELTKTIKSRKNTCEQKSYVASLLKSDVDNILKKIGEESTEVILAVKTKDNGKIIHEVSDLFFHLLVMLEKVEINFDKVLLELKSRQGVSGITEKGNRKYSD